MYKFCSISIILFFYLGKFFCVSVKIKVKNEKLNAKKKLGVCGNGVVNGSFLGSGSELAVRRLTRGRR